MIRKAFKGIKGPGKGKIRWRSHDVTRIEALSDGVFAFSISMLIFSLQVPSNAHDLIETIRGFVPFIFCFASIFMVWYSQYIFFRRYGMHDPVTIILNGILLFAVLFYIYPLKFIFTAMFLPERIKLFVEDVGALLYFYNAGFALIMFLFALMTKNALRRREELGLTPPEEFETRTSVQRGFMLMTFSLVVIVIGAIINAVQPQLTLISMYLYFLIWPAMKIHSGRRGKVFRKKFGNIPIEEPQLGTKD